MPSIRCGLTTSFCVINCPIFDVNCRHRNYQFDYLTVSQLIFLSRILFEYKLSDKDFWYQLITGKSLKDLYYKKEKEKELIQLSEQGKLEFPDNAPYITMEEINEILAGQKSTLISPSDPEYWDNERIEMARSDIAWKRRIALSDWYYDWYKKIKMKGYDNLVNRETLIKKKELDELMHQLSKDDSFTNERVIIDKSKLTKEKEILLNELLGQVLDPGYEIIYE